MGSGQSRSLPYGPNNPYGQAIPPPPFHYGTMNLDKGKRRPRGYSETYMQPHYPQHAPYAPQYGYGPPPPPGYGPPPGYPMFAPQPYPAHPAYPAPYGYGQPYGQHPPPARPPSPSRTPYDPVPNPMPRRVTNVYQSEKWKHLKRGASVSFTASRMTTMATEIPPSAPPSQPPSQAPAPSSTQSSVTDYDIVRPGDDDPSEAIANASMNAPSMPFLAATNSTTAAPLPTRTPVPLTPAAVPLPETPMTERSMPMHAWPPGATPGPSHAFIPPPPASRSSAMLAAGPPISFDPKSHPFSLTSPHKVLFKKKIYRTAAHLFYAQMFFKCRPDIAEEIRLLEDATAARFTARRQDADKRPDWDVIWQDKIDETLYAKFTQHAELRAQLLETDTRLLVNADSTDPLWGVGNDGTGKNELGKALMRVRDRLLRECGGTP